jgi:hypothetical protein
MRKGFMVLSAVFIIAMFVCGLCDYVITGKITWSGISISSILFTWLLLLPVFTKTKKKIRSVLTVFSIGIIPFLYVIDKRTGGEQWFWKLGIVVSMILIFYSWIMYILATKVIENKYIAAAITVGGISILVPLIEFVISRNYYTSFNQWDLLAIIISLMIGWILFMKRDRSTVKKTN